MTRRIFITGTDTGVGKTEIAAQILRYARARGLRPVPLKPAETGCLVDAAGELLPADGLRLRLAADRLDLPIERVVPNRYATPAAPAVAARLEHRPFSLPRVLEVAAALGEDGDLLVIEGAGGLLVPFDDQLFAADVAHALAATLIIVARTGLGTINHTLLTVAEARRRGLTITAVVLNEAVPPRAPDPTIPLNAAELERITGLRVLGPCPYGGTLSEVNLAALLEVEEEVPRQRGILAEHPAQRPR